MKDVRKNTLTHKQIEIIEQLLSDWWEYGDNKEEEENYKDEWRKKLGYICEQHPLKGKIDFGT